MIDEFQAYRHIFIPRLSTFHRYGDAASETMSRQRDIATTPDLNGQVTLRSITYTATQVSGVLCHSQH